MRGGEGRGDESVGGLRGIIVRAKGRWRGGWVEGGRRRKGHRGRERGWYCM